MFKFREKYCRHRCILCVFYVKTPKFFIPDTCFIFCPRNGFRPAPPDSRNEKGMPVQIGNISRCCKLLPSAGGYVSVTFEPLTPGGEGLRNGGESEGLPLQNTEDLTLAGNDRDLRKFLSLPRTVFTVFVRMFVLLSRLFSYIYKCGFNGRYPERPSLRPF